MSDWLSNPAACYVLAAYAVAGLGLLGLLAISWRAYQKRNIEWKSRQGG